MFLLLADPAAMDRALADLAARDERVARVGYRLVTRAAALCPVAGHPTGFALDRLTGYGPASRPAAARRGIGDQPTVTSVVAGSPAALAGVRVGDQLTAIDGVTFADGPALSPRGDPTAVAAADRVVADALANGRAELTLRRGGGERRSAIVVPPGCATRFGVRPEPALRGYADGLTVELTAGLVDLAATDGALAVPLAHELAHNILGHPAVLRASGRTADRVRATEVAADRLSVYLLDLAGYDFAETLAFWGRAGPKIDHGILGDRTHPRWRARVAAMTVEHDRIVAMRTAGQAIRPPADLLP